MACAGFTCSKNTLVLLNVLYIFVGLILIGVAAYSRLSAVIVSIPVIGGIIACGVFLWVVAIIGLIGAVKHHQVLLFFYMIILFLLFLMQFAIACACLAVNQSQQRILAETGWSKADDHLKGKVQEAFDCCGFERWEVSEEDASMGHPGCKQLNCCKSSPDVCCSDTYLNGNGTTTSNGTTPATPAPSSKCSCATCWSKVEPHIDLAFKTTGGIGLFFSFTEILGVWVTVRFRNQKDPRANPSAFL